MPYAAEDYVTRGRSSVQGWFSRIDAEIFHRVAKAQNEAHLVGSVAEIGLHHGKSFISLCLGLKGDEKAYGIDLFENQEQNIDFSGRGNKSMVERNLSKFDVDLQRIVLDQRSSQEVRSAEILKTVGPVRIFSIDGGHWQEVVQNDLVLAEQCLAPHGVIALDDFQRAEWPDVSAGYFAWYEKRTSPIMPFAIGFNKLYLCREEQLAFYGKALEASKFLKHFLCKNYVFQGSKIPIYQAFMQPEFGYRRRLVEHIKLYYPSLFTKLF